MKGPNVGILLDRIAAETISEDVDLWPAILPQLHARANKHKAPQVKIVVQILAAILLVFAVLFVISPEVRAQTGAVIRKIGELTFTNMIPRPQAATVPAPALPPDLPYSGHGRNMTLPQARVAVPFSFKVPTWVPDDFMADDQVGVYTAVSKACNCEVGWTVGKAWRKPASSDQGWGWPISIYLGIYKGDEALYPKIIETDLTTLEELYVNGRKTALLGPGGGIPAEPRLLQLSKELMWTDGGATYALQGSPGVPVEDLIHMAESIP